MLKEVGTNTTLKCKCGRTVVVYNGVIYGTDKSR